MSIPGTPDPDRGIDLPSVNLSTGVVLRPVRPSDAAGLSDALTANRSHLARSSPIRPDHFYSVAGQEEWIAQLQDGSRARTVIAWVLVRGERVIGRVILSNIRRGSLRSASLGYWVAANEQGRGLATAAVRAIVAIADQQLDLHRIEAGTLPDNLASQRVLARAGFRLIGLAPSYLLLDGAWRDHLLFQCLPGSKTDETDGPPS